MSIQLALNNALTGLRANQRSIAVLSNNIANANTDGYSRQSVDQSAMYVEGIGSGVRINEVVRKVDKYLQRAVQENGSTMSSAGILNDYATRVQVLLGEPGATNSLDEFMTTFFNSLQALAETPERTSLRSNVVQAGDALAREVSDLARGVQDLRREADQDMKDAVVAMNALMKKLDNVNAAIGRSQALGQSSAGLLDERDAALKGLAEYIDISVFYNSDGQVNVFTANGAALVDGNRHEILYTPLSSLDAYIDGDAFNAMTVRTLSHDGKELGEPQTIMTSGTSAEVKTRITGGKLAGLQQVRDQVMPEILAELDMMASQLRDEVNRVHNMGTSFPGPSSLTGTRLVKATQASDWTGTVRIAVLNTAGQPVTAGYSDETGTGFRPLDLNLGLLDSGNGQGTPTLQTIIDEINNHFGAPQAKAKVGALNNIQLTANTNLLPSGSPDLFNFDFDVENITGGSADFFVTNMRVVDDWGTDITSASNTAPVLNLASTGTFETYVGQDYFTVTTTATPSVAVGDWVFVPDPGGMPLTLGTLPSSTFVGQYFQVQSVTGNRIDLKLPTMTFTNTAETADIAGATAIPPYDTIESGENRRTNGNGTFTVDLSAAPAAPYYDVSVDVGVMDEDGNLSTSTVTYRIYNNKNNLSGVRYSATNVTGDGERILPYSSQEVMRAIMVDENGKEIRKIDGKYIDQPGYLKLIANDATYTVAIDSLDSRQMGNVSEDPKNTGTGRGFSHYFGLNNFFTDNNPTLTGDTLEGSALNLDIEDRILTNPNLLATGSITRSTQPADPNAPPQFTYVRNSGDNSLVQRLAAVSTSQIQFAAAGGLPATTLSVTEYLAEMLGYVASQAAAADANYSNAETLYTGFKSRLEAVTGVNLDEELANTIIYQNAYTASARIVKITDELYSDLLGIF